MALLLLSVGTLLGCVDRRLGPDAPEADPGEPGPFGVGVTTVEVDDPARDGRRFAVEVWYPSEVPSGAEVYTLEGEAPPELLEALYATGSFPLPRWPSTEGPVKPKARHG
jgi:hypothetical protein